MSQESNLKEPITDWDRQALGQCFNPTAVGEVPSLMNLVQRTVLWSLIAGIAPRTYLEIGTARGGSAAIVDNAIRTTGRKDFKGVCIDIRFSKIEENLLNHLSEHFHFIEMPVGIKAMQKAKLISSTFDIVLIDALHDEDNAHFDFLSVWPYVSPGGYILMDDANYFGVSRAIDSILAYTNAVDCGKICRFGGAGAAESAPGWVAPQDPAPIDEPIVWGGLHMLRKPLQSQV